MEADRKDYNRSLRCDRGCKNTRFENNKLRVRERAARGLLWLPIVPMIQMFQLIHDMRTHDDFFLYASEEVKAVLAKIKSSKIAMLTTR